MKGLVEVELASWRNMASRNERSIFVGLTYILKDLFLSTYLGHKKATSHFFLISTLADPSKLMPARA